MGSSFDHLFDAQRQLGTCGTVKCVPRFLRPFIWTARAFALRLPAHAHNCTAQPDGGHNPRRRPHNLHFCCLSLPSALHGLLVAGSRGSKPDKDGGWQQALAKRWEGLTTQQKVYTGWLAGLAHLI